LEAAVLQQPGDPDLVLQLVDCYRQQRRFADAEGTLERCLAAGGNHLSILDALDEMRLEAARARLEVAQRRAQKQLTSEATQLASDLRMELNRLEMEIYYQRSERYPSDLRVRYQLGRTLKRAGNFLQAMKYLQESAKLADLAGPAHLELGECLQHLRQFGRALDAYRFAVRSNGQPDPEVAKLGLYRAGLLAAALGQIEEARQYLGELERRDTDFRDVRAHLDKLGRIGDKG
jgi:tetratricopeptide (TPR) repeat protein